MQPPAKPKTEDIFVDTKIDLLFMSDITDRDKPEISLRVY